MLGLNCHLCFGVQQEEGLLACAFERGGWCAPDLWHEPSVRSGWLQGLLNTLNHRKALEFIRENGEHSHTSTTIYEMFFVLDENVSKLCL